MASSTCSSRRTCSGREDSDPRRRERTDSPAPGKARGAAASRDRPVRRPLPGDPLGPRARRSTRQRRGRRAQGLRRREPRRSSRGSAPSRQDVLRAPHGPDRPDPALRAGRRARRRVRSLRRSGHRRLPRRHRRDVQDPDGRADRRRQGLHVPREVTPPAAREVARPEGRRDPLPAALRRPGRQHRDARDLPAPRAPDRRHPQVPRRPRVPRGRDADDAADPRWRDRAPVQDASQRPRHGALSAHRARALPEAPGRRRPRAGVRDQPQLPERGRVDAAQPRVHDARVLSGVRRLHGPHGADRGAVHGARAIAPRHARTPVG